MSQSKIILIDYIEKTITEFRLALISKNYYQMRMIIEKLKAYSDCLKILLPGEIVETIFEDYDRHLLYVERFIEERNYDWLVENFDDIRGKDWPDIKLKIRDVKRSIQPLSKNIFLVHGRDMESVIELKEILLELGFYPIVLHEQPSGSRTIVEKLEKYSDVGFVFIILTPDDVGETVENFESTLSGVVEAGLDREDIYGDLMKYRARQNVVLEFGLFIGKLGRDRVCCLYKGDIELPSDMHGIVYVPFKNSVKECRNKIIKELKEIGYKINSVEH